MKSKTTINILRHGINTLPAFVYLKLIKMANNFQKWLISQGYSREYGTWGAWLKDGELTTGEDLFYKMEEWKQLNNLK